MEQFDLVSFYKIENQLKTGRFISFWISHLINLILFEIIVGQRNFDEDMLRCV